MNASSRMPPPGPLRFLGPAWFAVVMGLAGLALAWLRAVPLMGQAALGGALVAAALAAGVFAVLVVLSIARWRRYPQALHDDWRHPVRHVFVATAPLALLLLATLLAFLDGPSALARALWLMGAAAQLAVSAAFVRRWLQPSAGAAPLIALVTPAFLIPGVGNVVPALAGPALGYAGWAAAQLGIGAMLWVLILALIVVRLASHGPWPVPQLPATFVTIAPPSVIGLGLLQFGAGEAAGMALWGVALLFLLFSAAVARRMLEQGFTMVFWALSFPLTAFAALTLRLAPAAGPLMQLAAIAMLALASLVVLWLAWSTVQGLRRGDLLKPEPGMPPASPAGEQFVAQGERLAP